MRIALYIEDGLEQIVLTPETETEAGIVKKLHDGSRELSVYSGGFYACRGGWTRWEHNSSRACSTPEQDDKSTIIVLRRRSETSPPAK